MPPRFNQSLPANHEKRLASAYHGDIVLDRDVCWTLLGLRVKDVVQNSANHDEHVIRRIKGRNGGKPRRVFMLPRTLSKLMAFINKWGTELR